MSRRAFPAAIAALVALLAGCARKPAPSQDPSPPRVEGDTITFAEGAPQLASFGLEAATLEAAPPVSVTGRLSWDEDATVRVLPPVAGRIDALKAAVGSRVVSGDILAELSSPDFGQAQADAAKAAADLAVAGRSRDRLARLYERGAAPRKDLDAAEADLARARAESARTTARLARWGGDVASVSGSTGGPDQLFRLRTPLSGVVVERNANPGQEARPDATAPLFVVTNPRTLWVFLDVTERDLPLLSPGERLAVRSAAWPGRTFEGRLAVVGDALDPATRTVRARGRVENPENLLKAEMYVTVEVFGPNPAKTSVVPARAVLGDAASRYLFVEEGPRRFRKTTVTVGPEHGGKVPVLSSLPEGARVVTDGSLLLSSLLAGGGEKK
jgi:cobalt-zinc-cadmium efflux system membrane fusion protein